jgi:hypothetical protein
VCALPTNAAGLLGTDFLEKAGAFIDFACGKMSLTGFGNVPRVLGVPPTRNSALTVFTVSKVGRSSQLSLQEARHKGEQSSAGPHPEVNSQQSRTWLVKAKENIVVAPRCLQIVLGRLEFEKVSLHWFAWSQLRYL